MASEGIFLLLLMSWFASAAEPVGGVVATASSQADAQQSPARLVDNSGMDEDDRHDTNSAHMWLSLSAHGLNPRGGTVAGSHWVEFDLGQPYSLAAMKIWNYNGANLSGLGLKNITVQYSLTGGGQADEWSTIFAGAVPRSQGLGLGPSSVDLTISFNGVEAQYVVVTAAAWPDHNYLSNTYGEVGLSEARFFPAVGPQDCEEVRALGYSFAADLNNDCRVDLADFAIFTHYWLRCMDPADAACEIPWRY